MLPCCFGAWYLLDAFIVAPAMLLVEPILLEGYGGLVDSLVLRGSDITVLSVYGEADGQILRAELADNQLGFTLNSRTLSYSIPFYTSLHIAARGPGDWSSFAWCLLFLWLMLALGIVATILKDLMIALGDLYVIHPYTPSAPVTALLYQFSTLIVPSLAPVLLWAYSARDSDAFLSLLPASARPVQKSDD